VYAAQAHHDKGPKERIVRIGSHTGNGNLAARLSEHMTPNKDRSIFRKNIGRTLLARDGDDYLQVWDRCFTSTATRLAYGHLRDIDKEKRLETEVTRILREMFSFRYISIEGQERRMGGQGLEKALIGTIGVWSFSRVRGEHPNDVFCVASHGGKVMAQYALQVMPRGVIANDAGRRGYREMRIASQ
jgi:hypothetical protein